MFNILKRVKEVKKYSDNAVVSPVAGKMIPAAEINDAVFAKEIMGQTIGFVPFNGDVVCPVNGTVTIMFPTGHAFGIVSENGIGYLVHIGIDTVSLNGKGFKVFIKQGDKVIAGQKAVRMDMDMVKKAGFDTTTMLIVAEKPYENFKVNYIDYKMVEKSEQINIVLSGDN